MGMDGSRVELLQEDQLQKEEFVKGGWHIGGADAAAPSTLPR